jgi:hypothetical protein
VTYYLVPCGISILDGIKDGKGAPPNVTGRTTPLVKLRNWANDTMDQPVAAVMGSWAEAFEADAAPLRIPEWGPAVSAETHTLARRREGQARDGRSLKEAGDTVVLLASDTSRGFLAALLTATWIAGGDLARIRCAATPADPPAPSGGYPLDRGSIVVVRVVGLDPAVKDGFRAATYGIGDVMRAVRDKAAGDAIDLHLTGGFKATLLHTLALGEILRLTSLEPEKVTACYLFEHALADEGEPQMTEIGLRTFPGELGPVMLEELLTVYGRRHPDAPVFKGAAWSDEDDVPVLNAFGYGYLAILRRRSDLTDEGERARG